MNAIDELGKVNRDRTGASTQPLFGSPAQSQGDRWTPVNQTGKGNNLDLATVPQL